MDMESMKKKKKKRQLRHRPFHYFLAGWIRVILEAQSIAEKISEKEAEDTTLHHHYTTVLPPRLTPSLI